MGRSGHTSSRRFGVLHRTWISRYWRVVATAGVLFLSPPLAPAGEPPPVAKDDDDRGRKAEGPPINIFVNSPADLGAIWKSLTRPDFVILRGDEYAKLLGRSREETTLKPPWAAVVESIELSGSIS